MSTKSKARKARRHPEAQSNEVTSPHSLRGEERAAAGAIAGAILSVATLGVVGASRDAGAAPASSSQV